jgi:hypothetical protein
MLVIFLVLIYLLFAFFSYFLLPQACKKFVSESVFQIEELTVACFPTYNNNLYF